MQPAGTDFSSLLLNVKGKKSLLGTLCSDRGWGEVNDFSPEAAAKCPWGLQSLRYLGGRVVYDSL